MRKHLRALLSGSVQEKPDEFSPSVNKAFNGFRAVIQQVQKPTQRKMLERLQIMSSMMSGWALSQRAVVQVPETLARKNIGEVSLPNTMKDFQIPVINTEACVLYQFPNMGDLKEYQIPSMVFFLSDRQAWFPLNISFWMTGITNDAWDRICQYIPFTVEEVTYVERLGMQIPTPKTQEDLAKIMSRFAPALEILNGLIWTGTDRVAVLLDALGPYQLIQSTDGDRRDIEAVFRVIHGLSNMHLKKERWDEEECSQGQVFLRGPLFSVG
jgi:hypothetical protein